MREILPLLRGKHINNLEVEMILMKPGKVSFVYYGKCSYCEAIFLETTPYMNRKNPVTCPECNAGNVHFFSVDSDAGQACKKEADEWGVVSNKEVLF